MFEFVEVYFEFIYLFDYFVYVGFEIFIDEGMFGWFVDFVEYDLVVVKVLEIVYMFDLVFFYVDMYDYVWWFFDIFGCEWVVWGFDYFNVSDVVSYVEVCNWFK